jgi:hypothetical protein
MSPTVAEMVAPGPVGDDAHMRDHLGPRPSARSAATESADGSRREWRPLWRSIAVPDQKAVPPRDDATGDETRGKSTRGPAETATRPHLEGSEQGPS